MNICLIDLADNALLPTDTSESLELAAAFLSASAFFIQLWIFYLNAHALHHQTTPHLFTVHQVVVSSCIPYALQTSH